MKMPPISKIYEALSVIADERIEILKDSAKVKSSNAKKEYTIKWHQNEISSNDNATFWQKYPGYPIIAVWLKKGLISYDKNILKYFKKINWNELNKKNKRNYNESINEFLNGLVEQNIDTEWIEQQIDDIYSQIEKMSYNIVRKVTKN